MWITAEDNRKWRTIIAESIEIKVENTSIKKVVIKPIIKIKLESENKWNVDDKCDNRLLKVN